MLSRTMVVAHALLAACLPLCPADGRPVDDAIARMSGCTLLRELVFSEVLEAGLGGGGGAPQTDSWSANLQTCDRTVYTVSGAFSQALTEMNVFVAWRGQAASASRYCVATSLALCRPYGHPAFLHEGRQPDRFVEGVWHALRVGLADSMPLGTRADVTLFSDVGLRHSLRRSLVRFLAGDRLRYFRHGDARLRAS